MDALKKEKDKHLGLRIDSELHYKLHYISQYEGRSANGEVIYLIRKAIEEFEKEHGKIEKQYPGPFGPNSQESSQRASRHGCPHSFIRRK